MMRIANESELLAGVSTTLPNVDQALVLAPHPDDEVFGCGGTICLLRKAGVRVEVHIVTDGSLGGESPGGPLSKVRAKESRNALKALGLLKPTFWGLPDRGLCYGEPLISRILKTVESTGADLIFLPSPAELHPDHQVLAFSGLEALRRLGGERKVAFYELSSPLSNPNLFVNISAVAKRKQRAMECFHTQLAEQPYVERISGLNAFRSYSLGAEVTSAEAFVLMEVTALHDAQSILLGGSSTYRNKLGFAASGEDLPLVSIVVRSMAPLSLDMTLDSIATQTYANIEVIVVNAKGGEHRSLGDRCGRFPLRLVNQGERPLHRSKAANVGLDACRGAYIGFLDDDDSLDPGHIQALVDVLLESAVDVVVYSGVRGVFRGASAPSVVATFAEPDVTFPRLMLGNILPIHAVLFPATLLEQGVSFDESFDCYEDWDFWLQLTQLMPFVYVDQMNATYFMGGGSGVSPLAPDMVRAKHAARSVFSKWLKVISPDQMETMGDLFIQSKAETKAVESQLEGVEIELRIVNSELKASELRLRATESELKATESELKATESDLKTIEADLFRHSEQLEQSKADFAHAHAQKNVLEQLVAEVMGSRSWRLTAPMRSCGQKLRKLRTSGRSISHYFRREGIQGFLNKTLRVLRQEGWPGVKHRLVHRRVVEPYDNPANLDCNETAMTPSSLIWDAQNGYALTESTSEYSYIALRRPENFDQVVAAMQRQPVFSIIVPVYNTPVLLLEKLLASVKGQWYPNWQLILADDASPATETKGLLAQIDDPQIEVLTLEENCGIAGATNAAITKATGDYIVLLDHDDELTVDCLYELACCIDRDDPDYIYSDEDKIAADGTFTEPHFKPDWSPDTMMSTMYTCHVSCVRLALLEEVGGLRSSYDGCQDWDLVLRLTEKTTRISHIPKVLYHWRIIPGSTSEDLAAKSYVLDASKRVRIAALERRGLSGDVEPVEEVPGYFRVNYALQSSPLISIIVPTRDNESVLRRCLDSIRDLSGYENYEIIIMDNGSVDPDTLSFFDELRSRDAVTIVQHNAPFNFSELNNRGADVARGDLLLFLNDDTVVLTPDWLERMGGYAQLSHVGAVGAKLLYPGGREVQHVGVLNLENGPVHAFLNQPADSPGYFMRNLLEYNWLAVTGACLMVERKKFSQVGGFDERFPIAYNDIELSMRLHDAGYYNLVCSAVRLIHHESVSRGLDLQDEAKQKRLKGEWQQLSLLHPKYFQHDPFYNPNLHPNGTNFELME